MFNTKKAILLPYGNKLFFQLKNKGERSLHSWLPRYFFKKKVSTLYFVDY